MKIAVFAPMPSASVAMTVSVKAGRLLERSNRVAQIAHDGLQPRGPAHIAARFFHLLDAAELEARAAQRRLVRHALPLVLLRLALDVEAELVVELLLDGGAREQRAQTIANVAQEFSEHDDLPLFDR